MAKFKLSLYNVAPAVPSVVRLTNVAVSAKCNVFLDLVGLLLIKFISIEMWITSRLRHLMCSSVFGKIFV